MRDSHVRKNYGASPRDRPGWIRWRDRHPRAGRRPGCAAQKFRLASKSTDTMGKPANQPLYVHCCLRGAARNRWTRDSGRDELGTDRNQRILPQLPSSQFSQNHPLPHRKLNGFLFAMSTSRFGRDVWSCVPPRFKWTGIAQCSAGAAVIGAIGPSRSDPFPPVLRKNSIRRECL